MFTRLLNKIAGDYNTKQINIIKPLLQDIDRYYQDYLAHLPVDQIITKTTEFKTRIKSGQTLDQLLPEAFALVKYACHTMLGAEITVR